MESKQLGFVIGVDIGGTHIRVGAVTAQGTLHYFSKKKVKDILDPSQPIESLARFVNEYIESHVGFEAVIAIGMGFPSVVSKDKKSIYSTPNLDCLSNINIVDPLQVLIQKPVYINNDVNFLLQYEISQRVVGADEIVLGFYIGTGFGNAIYLHQQFLEGKHGAAAELGHIPAYKVGQVCTCGNIGCIEMIASGKWLVSLHQEHFSDVPFEDLFSVYSGAAQIEEFLQALAIPIATEINIFDPHVVILGGGVLGMKDFPKAKLEEYVLDYCRKPFPADGLDFEYAVEVSSAGVLGAASYIFDQLKRNSKLEINR
jgi:allose kinase